MEQTETYFSRGWYWDNTATFCQYYGNKLVAKFIVKMKPGFTFEQFV